MTPGRVKVLWLIKGLGLGGAERLLVSALPYLDREAFDYEAGYFLPWKNALVKELEAAGVRATCFGSRWNHGIGRLPRVVRCLQEHRVQVVHAHLPWASIVGRIAGRRCRVPAILYTEHGCWNRLHPVTRFVNRVTLGMNDLTIGVSDEVRRSMHGIDERRVRTIPNGIDCAELRVTPDERLAVRAELGVPANDFVVVNVANLIPVKNHELLLKAFSQFVQQYRASSLVLVGQLRETTASVRRAVAQLGLDGRVVITGPRTDVPRLVKAADAFALSSRSEGLPISLLEAMALGRPVVCTCVGGIPGVVTDGIEGFLVPVERPEAMADRFARLCDNPALRERMGQAGQEKVFAEYDISVMVRKVEDEYRRILESTSGERGAGSGEQGSRGSRGARSGERRGSGSTEHGAELGARSGERGRSGERRGRSGERAEGR